jgi:hypothetical protein
LAYTRRYLGEMLTRHGGPLDFDIVTELGFPDRAAYRRWMAQLAAANGKVAADEARFLDRSSTRAFVFEDDLSS